MLGAILRQPHKTWFFKLTAPPDEAAGLREEFGKFVASTRFENGQPSWEIPAGWTEERGRAMRFTTYHIGDNGPEVSISTLPNNSGETEAAVANINRWRRQLGLSELESDEYLEALESDNDAKDILPEDEGEIVTITTSAGKAILIDFVGDMASGGGPPFANMSRRAPAGPAPAPQANSRTPRLNPPAHWKTAAAGAFTTAAYEVGEGENTARITLSRAGGNLLDNVNRWRVQQLKLPPWTMKELEAEKQKLNGQGFTADYFKLTGINEAILGAIIPHQGTQWFVKLMGPKDLAQQEMENFEHFVESIEF
jgi:hypothetical protein